MTNTRMPFNVTMIAPASVDPRVMHTYDTTIYAGSLTDAHTVALEIMAGHNAQNSGFWSGWCYEIKGN
jgi:hypothetical protein